MLRKLKITLWVAVGLAIAVMVVIGSYQLGGIALNAFIWTMFGLLIAAGILIVYWTNKTITQASLRRYLLLAGASAIGILFFHCLHFLLEELMVMGLFVCPVALIVGAVLALRYKAKPA